MKLGAKKISNGKLKEIVIEMKEDKHSKEKKKFINESSNIAKRNRRK